MNLYRRCRTNMKYHSFPDFPLPCTLCKDGKNLSPAFQISILGIDGQVRLVRLARLVRLVRLQMDYFRLFLSKQTDKQQTSVCTMSKW